jgi:hypothetical protein
VNPILLSVSTRIFVVDAASVNKKRHRPPATLTGDFNASPQDSSVTSHSVVLKALDFQVV